jgi:PAS domain S-box-containing protein
VKEKADEILKESPSPILVYDSSDRLVYVNPSFEALTGWNEDEVIGAKLPFPWWPDELIPNITSKFRNAVHKGLRNKEMNYISKCGHDFYVDENMSKINGNGQCISTWTDITNDVLARKKMETMLRHATAQMENLVVEQRMANASIMARM